MCDFLGLAGQEDVEETDATAGDVNQVSPSFPHNVKRSTVVSPDLCIDPLKGGAVVHDSGVVLDFYPGHYSVAL